MCTNTLAYDGTVDNNLRYVGNNPCNYVTFNNETPVKKAKEWRNINPDTGRKSVNVYDTLEECNNHNTIHNNCQIVETIEEGWRIIGVMNNVDDGTGKKESRIKLIRTTSLGYYSWDTSEQITNTDNRKFGLNEWSQADLMRKLNGDYLDTTLNENKYWYNGSNNQKTGLYKYTKGLNSFSQSQISTVKWNLGGITPDNIYTAGQGTASLLYNAEKGITVWGNPIGTCDDEACPRTTSWIGKVALMYPSDYGFAIGDSVRSDCLTKNVANYSDNYGSNSGSCAENNWIVRMGRMQYTISNFAYLNNYVTGISNEIGHLGIMQCDNSENYSKYGVYPVVYLKPDVNITGEDGSPENPYTLG